MDDKLKVYIVSDYRVGAADGLAEFNFQTVHLLKEEFEFHFVQFRKDKPVDFILHEIIDGFKIHSFGVASQKKNMLTKLFYNWLAAVNKSNSIFHLHHIYNLSNYAVAKALKSLSLPYIVTPHDSYIYGKAYRKTLPVLKRIYRKFFILMYDKYVLDNARLIHGISDQCPPNLLRMTNTPVKVVTNQVKDIGAELNITNLLPQVCFIGRFNIQSKGIDLALEGFSIFKKKLFSEDNLKYVLIGPASDQAKATTTLLCKDLHLSLGEDVEFTGKLSVEDRNNILMRSKVYMQLSRIEGFGLSIAQALSCFKPVVVSKQVPIHEIIVKHKAGFVVNNPQEAAQALHAIFELNPDKYLEMALNARRCYETEFSPDVIKPKLLKLYRTAFDISEPIEKAEVV